MGATRSSLSVYHGAHIRKWRCPGLGFLQLHHAEVVDIDTLHHVDVVGIGLEYRVDVGDLPDMVGDGGVLRLGLREQQLHWKYMASEILPS